MPKSEVVVDTARRKRRRRQAAELPGTVEGVIAEMCRDLAVQTKRMQQLQEQAEALRTVFHQMVGRSIGDASPRSVTRAGRR